VGRRPWHARSVGWLRVAADVTRDEELREWFLRAASDLEAERPVICLDEILVAAERAVNAELATARAFRERGHNWSARWYALPDGRTFHSRDRGHLERSRHSVRRLETATELEEVFE